TPIEDQAVAVDGERVALVAGTVVLMLHKPVGVVSTAKDTHGRETVIDLAPQDAGRLYPVGRLDADTTGLLLLTNDGELANRLTHPRYEVPKTYRATVRNPPIRGSSLAVLRKGVQLEDGPTAPAHARRLTHDVIELTLREGRKRQVK